MMRTDMFTISSLTWAGCQGLAEGFRGAVHQPSASLQPPGIQPKTPRSNEGTGSFNVLSLNNLLGESCSHVHCDRYRAADHGVVADTEESHHLHMGGY